MSKDFSSQLADDFGEGYDDEVLVTRSATADQPADQPVEGEPKTQAEQASTGESPSDEAPEERPPAEEIPLEMPVAEVVLPLAEVATEPAKRPWWKQLFGSLFRREAEAVVEAEAPPVVEAVPLPKVAPEAIAPEALPEEIPEALEGALPAEEIPLEVPVAEAVPPLAEVAVEPAKRPWWKQLFGSLFGREAEAPPVVEVVPPPKVAPEAIAPEVVTEEIPELPEERPPAEEIPPEVPVVEAAPAPAEVAVEPAKRPWWKRLFGSLFRREAEAVVEVEAPPVVEVVPLPKVAPEEIAPEVLPYDRFLSALAEEKVTPPPEVLPQPPPPEEEVPLEAVAPAAPSFTLDDVRELVGEELARIQEDVVRMVQAKPAREQEERRRALLTAAQAVADSIYDLKVESARVELEALGEEQKRMLQDRDRPLRELMEDVDYRRERMAKAEQEITEIVAGTTRRVAEAAQRRAELEGSVVVLDLREEVERQKEVVAAVETRLASLPKITASGGLGLWPTLLALGLVAAVGLAGYCYRDRQARPPLFWSRWRPCTKSPARRRRPSARWMRRSRLGLATSRHWGAWARCTAS
jgi:hypothetical protein